MALEPNTFLSLAPAPVRIRGGGGSSWGDPEPASPDREAVGGLVVSGIISGVAAAIVAALLLGAAGKKRRRR